MNEETAKLIKLISENKTLNEISNMMNLSKKQLFTRMFMLRNYGYLIDKKYYYNGDISYYLSNPFRDNNKSLMIHTPSDMKSIRMILTSDSHFGNVKENLECADKIFDYCTKENISLIFHLGDFFEGVTRDSIKKQKYNSVQEQIKATLNNYPFVDNILTITLLGNHDASFWLDAGMDIKTILENKRHDIIPIGYGQEIVNIANCQFILKHPIERCRIDFTTL